MMRRFLATAVFLSSAFGLGAAIIPRQAPEYVINVPGRGQELLSKHKGKVVVLEFLMTTCPHCQDSAKVLSKLQREFGSKMQVLGVAINPNPDVAGFTRQYATDFLVGSNTRETAMGFLQHSIMAPNFYVPQMVFIDKKGVIRAQYGGTDNFLNAAQEMNIRNMINRLLAEPGGAVAPAKSKPAAKKPAAAAKKEQS
ncbi:MAG TPA: TlpA disulfide reductase family protein [Bryobacteraceae bacterium]|nr:TlpA disulfide reductase family protein [Bryobacteraceae bacterium]